MPARHLLPLKKMKVVRDADGEAAGACSVCLTLLLQLQRELMNGGDFVGR